MRRGIHVAGILAMIGATYACSKKQDAALGPLTPVPETWVAQMRADKEVPTPLTVGSSGTGTFVFQADGTIDYTIAVSGLSALPSAMHIHAPGDATQAAGVIVGFNGFAVATSGTIAQGKIIGVSSTISMDSLKALIRNGKVYAQVHTTAFPGGEIRGQLVKQ
jgi:hypothetical protein